MSESDRFRWMETAREGVNQRGLDELSNSKRAHFNYEGGPVFSLINANVGTSTSNRSDEFNFGSNNITDYASAVANLFSGHAHFTFDGMVTFWACAGNGFNIFVKKTNLRLA